MRKLVVQVKIVLTLSHTQLLFLPYQYCSHCFHSRCCFVTTTRFKSSSSPNPTKSTANRPASLPKGYHSASPTRARHSAAQRSQKESQAVGKQAIQRFAPMRQIHSAPLKAMISLYTCQPRACPSSTSRCRQSRQHGLRRLRPQHVRREGKADTREE